MSDTLSEMEACDLLARLFRARGYAIQRNVPFREYGVEFHIDGWDAKARVGFEFLSSEDDDHDDLSLEEYKTLNMAQQRGELSLFIIDEVEPVSAEDLKATVHEFLDEAAEAVLARRTGKRPAKKAVVRRTAARKTAAGNRAATAARKGAKKVVKKAVGRKRAVKKAVVRKPKPRAAKAGRRKA